MRRVKRSAWVSLVVSLLKTKSVYAATREFDKTTQLSPNRWKFKRLTGIMEIEDKGEAAVGSKDAWPLQDPGGAWPRRDGRGVPRHRSADRARGRAQDAASRAAGGGARRGAGALPPRSALGRPAQSPQHRHHPRCRRAGRRRLHRDGAARGPLAAADAEGPA